MKEILGFDDFMRCFSEETYQRRAFIGYVIERFNFIDHMIKGILKLKDNAKLGESNKMKDKIEKLLEINVIDQGLFELLEEIRNLRNPCSHAIKPIDKNTGSLYLKYIDEDSGKERVFRFDKEHLIDFQKKTDACDRLLFRVWTDVAKEQGKKITIFD